MSKMPFKVGTEFIIERHYNLIIPQLDISKCNIELFNNKTINKWKEFTNTFNIGFEEAIKKIKKGKYKIIEKKLFIKVPYGYRNNIWDNYPDLYNCDGNQVLLFLEKTQNKLSDIYIRTSPTEGIINCKITPENFPNLSICDYQRLTEILIKNGETSPTIWCAIACWWNYSINPIINKIHIIKVVGSVGSLLNVEQVEKKQEIINHEIENEDILIEILNTYCCPKIYSRCNWFLMLHSCVKKNEFIKVTNWINENKKYVEWDEDLLNDTPSNAFNETYEDYKDNKLILKELGRRFIS